MSADTAPAVPAAPRTAPRARWRETLGLLAREPLAVGAAVVLALVVVAGVLSPLLAPYDAVAGLDIDARLQAPSLAHPFGTDELGRDVLSRVLVGARLSLLVAVVSVVVALGAGVLIGLVAGFYGGAADAVAMRAMDTIFAFPAILLAIAILAVRGPGIGNAIIAIGIVYTPIFARVTRAAVLRVREEVYIRAIRSLGAGDLRLLARHVLPNALGPIIVQTSLSLAFALLTEAALSFLGLGVQPPTPSWGRMLIEARGFVEQAWWMGVFPGLVIFVTVLSCNLLGDALRDVLDPRQRSAMAARAGSGEAVRAGG